MTISLRTKLAGLRDARATSALLLVAWRERKRNPTQLLAVSRAVGSALGVSRPATWAEMQQWYCEYGATRDEELLDRMAGHP